MKSCKLNWFGFLWEIGSRKKKKGDRIMQVKILIVQRQDLLINLLKSMPFIDDKIEFIAANKPEFVLEMIRQEQPHIVFCNMGFRGEFGVALIKEIRERFKKNAPYVIAGSTDQANRLLAQEAGANIFVFEPNANLSFWEHFLIGFEAGFAKALSLA